MAYNNSTNFFGIPYMAGGDVLTELDEAQQLNVIDGLLAASIWNLRNGVIAEGAYSLETGVDLARLHISKVGPCSLFLLMDKRPVWSSEEIITAPFEKTGTWYIYHQKNSGLSINLTNANIVVSRDNPIVNHFLLATVVFENGVGTIDYTTGKSYYSSFFTHLEATTNPHGESIVQSNLSVGTSLSVKGKAVVGCIYATIISSGTTGTQWYEFGSKPLFCVAYGSESIGEVYWVIEGNILTVYNTGSSGIEIKLKIDVEEDLTFTELSSSSSEESSSSSEVSSSSSE